MQNGLLGLPLTGEGGLADAAVGHLGTVAGAAVRPECCPARAQSDDAAPAGGNRYHRGTPGPCPIASTVWICAPWGQDAVYLPCCKLNHKPMPLPL